jgi:hypothetical protein
MNVGMGAANLQKLRVFLIFFGILIFALLALCILSFLSSYLFKSVNCSMGKEVCITIDKVQNFTIGEPMRLNINVTSTKDYSNLHVALQTTHDITVDGPQTWENYLTNSVNKLGLAYWDFSIKAGQTLTFKRVLHIPQEEGYYSILAEVVNTGRSITASESLNILVEHKTVYVAANGTLLPAHTSNATPAAYGPGTPAPTFITAPSIQTPFPTPKPPSTPSSPLLETSYPPPSTPTPSPTSQSSPYP